VKSKYNPSLYHMASILMDFQSEEGYWFSLLDTDKTPNMWLTSHIVYFCKDINVPPLKKGIKRASEWLHRHLKEQVSKPKLTNEFLQKTLLSIIALDFKVSNDVKLKISNLIYKTFNEYKCWFNDVITSSLAIIALLNVEEHIGDELKQIIKYYSNWIYGEVTRPEPLEESELYWVTVALKQVYNKVNENKNHIKQALLKLSNVCELSVRELDKDITLDRKLWLLLTLHECITCEGIFEKSKIKLLKEIFDSASKEIDQIAYMISEWFFNAFQVFVRNIHDKIYQTGTDKEKKYIQVNIPSNLVYRMLPPDLTSIALFIKLLSILKKYIICIVTQEDFEKFKEKTKWSRVILSSLSGIIYALSNLLIINPSFFVQQSYLRQILKGFLTCISIASSILLTISTNTNLEDIHVKEVIRNIRTMFIMLVLMLISVLAFYLSSFISR